MPETKHTPGPWKAEEQFAKVGKDAPPHSLGWIINHSNGRIGWSSYATAVPNEGEERPFPIGAANARLIAVAPDMLAELCTAVLLADEAADAFRRAGLPNQSDEAARTGEKFRAVITKATSA